MKTITLVVEGVADSQADNNEAIEVEIKGKTDGAETAGRAAVDALRKGGVTVTAARLVVLPRSGSHEAATTIDLAVEPAAPAAPAAPEEAPASEPAPATP